MNIPLETQTETIPTSWKIIASDDTPDSKSLHQQYLDDGCTAVFPVAPLDLLLPVHKIIFEKTAHLLGREAGNLPFHEAIRLPFVREPEKDDFKSLVAAVEGEQSFQDLIHSNAVQDAFKKVFDTANVTPFPISRLRAQFPSLGKTTYNWHQDEGTWYAIKVKSLAHKMPATLWLSINGADETNSIEVVPGTHHCKLQNHSLVEGQGFFNAPLPEEFAHSEHRVIRAEPGDGVAFHPLTFHRSVPGKSLKPRYSIDIRYYSVESAKERYGVNFRFFLKRLFS